MPLSSSFACDYRRARKLFRKAAATAGAILDSHTNPLTGPAGEELATDTAWLGPTDAEAVIVVLSGTHGVEGFCGSGAQVQFLRRGEFEHYPAGIAVLLVHAVNPFGFAWLRRVNEDNVDLNRNWLDFDQPVPDNSAYTALRRAICPAEWTKESGIARDPELSAHARQFGFSALQTAISSGQWSDPSGVFYGGSAPTWSRRTQQAIIDRHLVGRRKIAILDMHTGLGPAGLCERISTVALDTSAGARAASWFGAGLTSPAGGTSTSAPIHGDGLSHAIRTLSGSDVVAIALEYGTVPIEHMLDAVRADAWLHANGDLESDLGRQIKHTLRDAFYTDDDCWRGMVVGQLLLTARQAAAAMAC